MPIKTWYAIVRLKDNELLALVAEFDTAERFRSALTELTGDDHEIENWKMYMKN